MNERIRELNYQALCDVMNGPDPDGDVEQMYIPAEFMKKFAELIVRECAELIDNKVTITAAQTYDEVFVAKFDTKELCAKQIKEHFGVKE
jgi:hypothetical protein